MTTSVSSSTTTAPTTLPDLAEGDHSQRMLVDIGCMVNFGLPGVRVDVERWLSWMLAGGSRPKATIRSVNANGVNAYALTQDVVCATLDHFIRSIDWDNPTHFKLIERATRPSPGTTPLI